MVAPYGCFTTTRLPRAWRRCRALRNMQSSEHEMKLGMLLTFDILEDVQILPIEQTMQPAQNPIYLSKLLQVALG